MAETKRPRLRLIDAAARVGGRLFMPTAAALQEQEIASGAFGDEAEIPETIRVIDRGSDTTVFSFSSAGLLHAGLPTFAFEGLFERQERAYNLVILRDVHRTAYHLTPAGEPTGLAHYESILLDTMKRLGAKRHVAIGESSGAAAALYFGTRCGMDKVVAFSLPYPIQIWTSLRAIFRAVFNLPELLRDPAGYWEVLMITLFSVLARRALRRHVGEAIFNPLTTYLEATPRPQLTLHYGERCRPDAQIAAQIDAAPEARCVPFATGRHILWTSIARQGSLEQLLMRELESPGSGS